MTFNLGVYEVFATTFPGGLLLAALAHVFRRLGLIDFTELQEYGSLFLVIVGFALSMLLGLLIYPASGSALRWSRKGRVSLPEVARTEFRARNPSFANQPFVDSDPFTLFAGLQISHPEASEEISSHRAQGVMMRASAVSLAAAAIVASVEIFTSDRSAVAAACAVALLLAAYRSLRESERRAKWAYMKTFELVTWSDDVQSRCGPRGPASDPGPD